MIIFKNDSEVMSSNFLYLSRGNLKFFILLVKSNKFWKQRLRFSIQIVYNLETYVITV